MYNVIPVRREDDALTIATNDPQNLVIQDDLRTFLGLEIRVLVATQREVTAALEKYYNAGGESVERLVEELENDEGLKKLAEEMETSTAFDLTSAEALADSAPVRKLLNMILLLAIKDHASDIHFEPFEEEFRIRIKADGRTVRNGATTSTSGVCDHDADQGDGGPGYCRTPHAARRSDRTGRRRSLGGPARQCAADHVWRKHGHAGPGSLSRVARLEQSRDGCAHDEGIPGRSSRNRTESYW